MEELERVLDILNKAKVKLDSLYADFASEAKAGRKMLFFEVSEELDEAILRLRKILSDIKGSSIR